MGFREEGRLKNHVKIDDCYFDDLLMALEMKDNHQKNDFSIRVMTESDIDSLSHTFCFPWTTFQKTLEKWQQYYVEQQAHGRTVCLLEASNQLIGYGSLLRVSQYPYFRDNKIPEINDIWIKEELRNRGFGKALITHLENMARDEDYEQIGIGVGLYRDYGPAQKLYVEMGYAPDGKGITYKYVYVTPGKPYPVDDDLITWMQKAL